MPRIVASVSSLFACPGFHVFYTENEALGLRDFHMGRDVKRINSMEFADKLKQLRTERGLSQEKLAEQIGVSRQVITKWESGTGTPKIDNLKTLADYFHVTIDEILGRSQMQYEELTTQYTAAMRELRFHTQTSLDLVNRIMQIGTHLSREQKEQ